MNWLYRRLLTAALRRACGGTVVRVGEGADKVNCYNVRIDKDDLPHLVVLGITNNDLSCLEFNGESFSDPATISIDEVDPREISIVHFYGVSTTTYEGMLDFAIGRMTAWPYIQIHAVRLFDRLAQGVFNRRKLATKKRIELLEFMVNKRVSDGQDTFDALDLTIDIYSLRLVSHSAWETQQSLVEFYLDSLTETGELILDNGAYRLTGKAIKTLEEEEELKRRHGENASLQRRMFYLTALIVLLTLVQAGLIRLPMLLDLSGQDSNASTQRASK